MKNLEFHVEDIPHYTLSTFEKALEAAVLLSISTGKYVNVDVLAHDENAARAFGGEYGVESYRKNPDAKVFHRIAVLARDVGQVP